MSKSYGISIYLYMIIYKYHNEHIIPSFVRSKVPSFVIPSKVHIYHRLQIELLSGIFDEYIFECGKIVCVL